jgi:hypothetical protein
MGWHRHRHSLPCSAETEHLCLFIFCTYNSLFCLSFFLKQEKKHYFDFGFQITKEVQQFDCPTI